MKYSKEPPQPPREEWQFIRELRQREKRTFPPYPGSIDRETIKLAGGIRLVRNFPDSAGMLETAYEDLTHFLTENGIRDNGDYEIITATGNGLPDDSFKISITSHCCRITAENREGIRRGIYYLEDLLLSSGGPFLPPGETTRMPWLKNRISRCFFGPIKRPPLNRDELLDDLNYYPEEYLNRLAHEGINGLWLTVAFKDLCRTSIMEAPRATAEKRLEKLRQTVKRCLRYGIKTYIFCIEPAAWRQDDPVLKIHPELAGVPYEDMRCFCPFSDTAQKYLYEAVYSIFQAVPGLGGMINISNGERLTTCLSTVSPTAPAMMNCPGCRQKAPWEIIRTSLAAMEKGMHDAAPEAQLISWLYMPPPEQLADWVFEIAAHLPPKVTLQFNFESGGTEDQLGKKRIGGDYWLSYIGPSDSFRQIAATARPTATPLSAKIQVGCCHEIATVPFIPVPSQLYRKYRRMRELGVTSVMQCWYFGNYPGVMNQAAGMLAFEDFSGNEKEFLYRLARPVWGKYADTVVEAWVRFAAGYACYPLSNMFQYYGPMHDGVVWPLHLFPIRQSLVPTWKLEFGTSGDAIGECLENHTLEEAIRLCRDMSEQWNQGVTILSGLRDRWPDNPARLQDITVAEAIGIQFESGYHILRFYALRDRLFKATPAEQPALLDEMADLVKAEQQQSERLFELCEVDSRLGFHSETEGYKYFPAKLKWRIARLEELLQQDFPRARAAAAAGQLTYPIPEKIAVYHCGHDTVIAGETFRWYAEEQPDTLSFEIECRGRESVDRLFLSLGTGDTAFPLIFELESSGQIIYAPPTCTVRVTGHAGDWTAAIAIPISVIGNPTNIPLRLNIIRTVSIAGQISHFGWPDAAVDGSSYRQSLAFYHPQQGGLFYVQEKNQKKIEKKRQLEFQTI